MQVSSFRSETWTDPYVEYRRFSVGPDPHRAWPPRAVCLLCVWILITHGCGAGVRHVGILELGNLSCGCSRDISFLVHEGFFLSLLSMYLRDVEVI